MSDATEVKAPKTTLEAVEQLAEMAKANHMLNDEANDIAQKWRKANDRFNDRVDFCRRAGLVEAGRAYTTSEGVLVFLYDGSVALLPLEIPAVKEAPTSRK